MNKCVTQKNPIICLMGTTASGKTALAIQIAQQFPCEIVSVDSAMIYRSMNIGTAKPNKAMLKFAPHHLIDIVDPTEIYSVGRFRIDALREINAIYERGNIPLLVGGTMMYFHTLQKGLAPLPKSDHTLRKTISERIKNKGWHSLHDYLAHIDKEAAERIHPHDEQRLHRAIEVYELTGQSITAWQVHETAPLFNYPCYHLALTPFDRTLLHQRIKKRFHEMLDLGLLAEVQKLYERGDLSLDNPSIRSLNYRQLWSYFSGQLSYEAACEKAIIATRQFAKRQLTWLRSWADATWIDSEALHLFDHVAKILQLTIAAK